MFAINTLPAPEGSLRPRAHCSASTHRPLPFSHPTTHTGNPTQAHTGARLPRPGIPAVPRDWGQAPLQSSPNPTRVWDDFAKSPASAFRSLFLGLAPRQWERQRGNGGHVERTDNPWLNTHPPRDTP